MPSATKPRRIDRRAMGYLLRMRSQDSCLNMLEKFKIKESPK
jgi:hypothetical protein